ncbi:MAG TPA: secretin N-terminal domain-containing protein [Opitutaceae bacterium]|nr:secretin N-terminal domain-containing protein [Opitutaceae bacterium]
MTSRFARLCLALLSSFAALNLRAQAQPAPASPPPLPTLPQATPGATAPGGPGSIVAPDDDPVSIVLPDADLDTILNALENLTGRIILRPAALPTATYNLRIKKSIPKSAAIRYIETILALNNIGIVPLDDHAYKVTALTMTRVEAPEMITGSALSMPPSGKIMTKLFQLEFLRVQELLPMLQMILNPNTGGPVQLQNANAVLLTDSVTNLQRVESLLQQVDKPVSAGMKPKFYQLKNGAKASDVVTKLRGILTGTLQIQLGSATTYSADDRTNQIVLVTDPRQHEFFDELIDKLDTKADPITRNDVIHLNHAKAEEVVTVLTRLTQGQTQAIRQNSQSVRPGSGPQPVQSTATLNPGGPVPPPPAAPGAMPTLESLGAGSSEFSGITTIINDNRTNSVVVSGTVDDVRLLRELVAKLDIVLAQVRIEVVIAEVTLDDNHQSGISALGLKIEGDKLVGFSANAVGFTATNGTVTRPGLDLAAEIAITTSPRKSNNTVVSVPAIVTSHGKESVIFSGESRPVVTGVVQSAAGSTTGLASSSTVQQLQIGTRLTVTPYIGVDGSVQLDIKQKVEDVTSEVQIDNNTQYVIGTREANNYVTAKTGDVIVLGGFQKKIDLKSTSRLGPIPILGDIFGSRRKDRFRQELIFFLRPTVLTNDATVDNAETMRRVEKLPTADVIKQQLDPTYQPPKESVIDRIMPK